MLVVLALFALIVLFAGWFLDPAAVEPARLYIGFILGATNLLVCAVVLVLSVFSLPADIKSKAIQTVTTKPVQMAEIVLCSTPTRSPPSTLRKCGGTTAR